MKEQLLEVKNLNVEYHSDSNVFHAVNGISFDLGYQETIGLVGETGAGKTTTALAIMQLLSERTSRINSGEIIFKGENILARSQEEMQEIRGAKISMIFQDPMTCLNPLMTVGDHAKNDMAGGAETSWKNLLAADGYQVTCVMEGLSQLPGIRERILMR